MKTSTLFLLLIALVIVGGLFFALFYVRGESAQLSINSFQECVAAGNPIMESYPEQCRTKDGRLFVNEEQSVPDQGTGAAAGGTFPAGQCVRAGCSQQLCVEAGEASDIVTTCEYRAEYACYNTARCERQVSGACGWTQTAELQQCLGNPPALQGDVQAVY